MISLLDVSEYKDLLETISGISPRILSRELQELEMNYLITRMVNNTKPATVSYVLTTYAAEPRGVIDALIEFGQKHRSKIKEM